MTIMYIAVPRIRPMIHKYKCVYCTIASSSDLLPSQLPIHVAIIVLVIDSIIEGRYRIKFSQGCKLFCDDDYSGSKIYCKGSFCLAEINKIN